MATARVSFHSYHRDLDYEFPPPKTQLSAQIANDIARFLASGGVITVLATSAGSKREKTYREYHAATYRSAFDRRIKLDRERIEARQRLRSA